MDLYVRRAIPEDFEAICELADQMDRPHREHLPDRFQKPVGTARRRDRTDALMRDPDTFLAVAEFDGRVVGIVNAGLETMPDYPQKRPLRSVTVRGIVVRQELRRQKVGSALLSEVRKWARERGADEIQANVYDFNTAAHAFFSNAGLKPLSHRLVLPLATAGR
jgi:GNAT superfamily N-acetyltransferase